MGSNSLKLSIIWLENFGARYCMGSKSSEFGIGWARKVRSLVLYGLETQLNYFFLCVSIDSLI